MTMMAQDFISAEMIEDFTADSYEKLTILEGSLRHDSDAACAAFQREAHSLKGNAQIYGFRALADLCHRMETDLAGGWTEAVRAHLGVYLVHIDVALSQLTSD